LPQRHATETMRWRAFKSGSQLADKTGGHAVSAQSVHYAAGNERVPDEGDIATPGHYTTLWAAAAY